MRRPANTAKEAPNKRMQADQPTHYASYLAADAERYAVVQINENYKV